MVANVRSALTPVHCAILSGDLETCEYFDIIRFVSTGADTENCRSGLTKLH